MLSKKQLKKQIAGIREYVISEVGLSASQIKAACENAEALEELLSLREQLAELKALEPVGRVISCSGNKTLGWMRDAPEGTLLFTAAKPAED